MSRRTLAALFAASLSAVGTVAMLAPRRAAAMFGLAAEGPALAYMRACGGRDLVFGALIAATLDDPRALRTMLQLVSTVPVLDAMLLFAERGARPSHVLHLGGAAAMFWAAQRDDGA